MVEHDAPPPAPKRWSLPKLLALAFAAGLVLFVLVWLGSRRDNDFYTAPTDADPAQDSALPAPIAPDLADGNGASGLQIDATQRPAPPPADAPGIVQRPPSPVAPSAPVPTPDPGIATGDRATPVPVSTPAPRYPREAFRRDIDGTVRVRIHVAPDGSVESNDIESSSGNRLLDRAALEASRRWVFQPATRNGQPVAADVVVPITFQH